MRRTMISAKGFTAPRSHGDAAAPAPRDVGLTRPPTSARHSRGGAAGDRAGSHQRRASGSAVTSDDQPRRPSTSLRHSTQADTHTSRKRPRASKTAAPSQGSAQLEATGSQRSLNTDGGSAKKRSRPSHHQANPSRGNISTDSDDEDSHDLRSRRLHNGDVIALAPPPPKNIAQPGAPRGLLHPSGGGARRQVVYPDPVVPTASSFAFYDHTQPDVASTSVPLPGEASLNQVIAPTDPHSRGAECLPWHPEAPQEKFLTTPVRVVTYPENRQYPMAAEDGASPQAVPPISPGTAATATTTSAAPGFSFADAIASTAASSAASSASRPSQPQPSSSSIPPSQSFSAGEASSSASTALSTNTAIAVHQHNFLQAMMEAVDGTASLPSLSGLDNSTGPHPTNFGATDFSAQTHGPAATGLPETVVLAETESTRTVTDTTTPAASMPSSSVAAALTETAARVLLWEPTLSSASPPPRRRTMISVAKPRPEATITPTSPPAGVADTAEEHPSMTTADGALTGTTATLVPPSSPLQPLPAAVEAPRGEEDAEEEVAPTTAAAAVITPDVRGDSAESAALFSDRDDDGAEEPPARAPPCHPHDEESTAAVNDTDDRQRQLRDAALDREVEEDLRLSEDLPFTPSGFYSSSPFAAQRLSQEDATASTALTLAEPLTRLAVPHSGGAATEGTAPPAPHPLQPAADGVARTKSSSAPTEDASQHLALHQMAVKTRSPTTSASGTRTTFRFTPATPSHATTNAATAQVTAVADPAPTHPPEVSTLDAHRYPAAVATVVPESAVAPTVHGAVGSLPSPLSAHEPITVPAVGDASTAPPHSHPTEGERPESEGAVRVAGRPARTLFSFGTAPPPTKPLMEPIARPPPLTATSDRDSASRTSYPTAAQVTSSPARSFPSAEPTELFTDGDSVSVPCPPLPPPPVPSDPIAHPETGGSDPNYGLPPHAFSLFMRQRRISAFYAWQHEVLTSADLLQGRNYVYSLPTSGGKTLVAEVSLLRCLMNRQHSCFFVLPFVSLAEEKTAALLPLGDAFGFRVEGHYGFTGRFPLPTGPAVYVCTIEKANSVLSYLLEERRAEAELGMVVVDELHMLGESRRGATLEVFLSKLLLLRARQQAASEATLRAPTAAPAQAVVQIVGMSATVPNLPVIARWLDAACYEGTYRPVPLHQYSVVDGMVLRDGERNERNLSGRNEVEQLLELATEVTDCSVLVFCASRQQCVDTAKGIVRYMQQTTTQRMAAEANATLSDALDKSKAASPPPLQPHYTGAQDALVSRAVALGAQPPQAAAALHALLNELMSLSYGQADQLGDLIPFGVAYHHGGLLAEERELIEGAYRDRHLRILCCTSTLAAGVNLPARRVIFKSPYTGREFLTKSRYLQMCGRAGRAGLDTYGESFLLLNRRDRQRGLRLMREPLEPCESQLLEEHSQFVRSLLECISVGVVTSSPDGLTAWAQSLFCGYALGALDALTTADLWRHHSAMWLTAATTAATTITAAAPTTGDGAVVAATIPSGIIQLVHPGVVPPAKSALSAAEQRALRHAFVAQPERFLHVLLEAAVQELLTHGFVELSEPCDNGTEAVDEPTRRLTATPFGTSSVRSCFSVESALLVRTELNEMLHTGLILADDLHLCYFLTPLREIPENCDWVLYRTVLAHLSDSRQRIASLIGLDEFYIDQRAMGLANPSSALAASDEARRKSFTARRFWVALILADVLAEVPMSDVVARFGVNRGMLQDVMRSASMFSSSITSFCHAMGWYSLEAVLASFVKRLGFGVKPDIVPLMDIRGVQPSRARALWNAGYKDPARVAAADPDEMVTRVKESNPPDSKSAKFFTKRSALMVIREASLLLESQIREKKGELKELTARTAL